MLREHLSISFESFSAGGTYGGLLGERLVFQKEEWNHRPEQSNRFVVSPLIPCASKRWLVRSIIGQREEKVKLPPYLAVKKDCWLFKSCCLVGGLLSGVLSTWAVQVRAVPPFRLAGELWEHRSRSYV